MINTYQTSLAPPPLPPRLSRSQAVLIPGPLPSQSHTKVLIRFLVGVVVLQLVLSVAGFIFLYHNDVMLKGTEEKNLREIEGKAAFLSSDDHETSHGALARMMVESTAENAPGYLQWNIKHSLRRNVGYYQRSWVTVLQSGDYFVYSRVTFSKSDPQLVLFSSVKLRKKETEKEETVMQAYCSLPSSTNHPVGLPHKCTATQGQLVTLEKGNQLSVWVERLSLVDYDDRATTFGMYKL
ncbi:CD40 ligand [Stegastes partitus]|uniref:Tumor necrosis factor ligand superfamily member 6-like n=1 Tax=Stegastes partitus TaxID=144197 RepID=A0A3B4ZZE6_9TELE|nr:PREDICTED: tumor necrosis factor ligand superfamily member 6-like [Stegastes partitus]